MANRKQYIDGVLVELTDEQETFRTTEEKAWTDAAPARRMVELRRQRDALLVETDYMALGDVTLSDAWKTYRQALRDITDQTPSDDVLSNITWPTKPS